MKKIIEEALPTKVSRIAAIWTVPAATSGYFIVGSLRPLMGFWKDETVTILQVTVFLALSLLGCLTIIASLIHHIKTRDIEITINKFPSPEKDEEEIDIQQDPSEYSNSILLYCIENDITTFFSEDIINNIQHSRIQLEAALEELETLKLIDISSYYATGREYVLSSQGKILALKMSSNQ